MSKFMAKLSGKKDKDPASPQTSKVAGNTASSNTTTPTKGPSSTTNSAAAAAPGSNTAAQQASTTGATAPTGGASSTTAAAPPTSGPTSSGTTANSSAAPYTTGSTTAAPAPAPSSTTAAAPTATTTNAATQGGTGAVPVGTTPTSSTTGAAPPTSSTAAPTSSATGTAPTTTDRSAVGATAPGTAAGTTQPTSTSSAAAPAAAAGAAGVAAGAAGGAAGASHHVGEPASAGTGALRPSATPKQANIAIIVWSLYGHVAKLAEEVAKGVQSSGAKLTIYQFQETLPDEVITKMYGNKAPIASLPVITPDALKQYDGFIMGFPTRYGRAPSQVSAFFDQCGGLWMSGGLIGKFAGIFTSSASQHGGQETTALTTMPWLAHMGVTFVPLGIQCPELTEITSVQGGSWWGASTVAAGDGHLQPTTNDLTVAQKQGLYFGKTVGQFVRGAEL